MYTHKPTIEHFIQSDSWQILTNFLLLWNFKHVSYLFCIKTVADQQKTKELEKVETKVSDPTKEVQSVSDRKEKQVKRHHSTEKKDKERHKEKSKDSKEKVKDSKSGTKDGKKGKSGLEVDPEIEDLLTNREEGECRRMDYLDICGHQFSWILWNNSFKDM